MISLAGRRSIIVIVLTVLTSVNCESHVPSLTEISHVNDPVLKEVFASSGIPSKSGVTDFDDHPQLPQKASAPRHEKRRYYGEIPIEHNQPLGPVPYKEDAMSRAVDTGVSALATGANVLYRGATSVGQAFGINPQTYEAPLFNAATRFFGRK